MILTTDKMVFVTDLENSDEYIENLITEYGTNQYRIKVDRTLNPPYYQLFYEWKKASERLIIICFLQVNWERLWITLIRIFNNE